MMLKKIYYWFHRLTSKSDERGECSSGYWPYRIRKEALALCSNLSEGRVIELGCGEGLFLTQLASQNHKLKIWGVDNNNIRLKEAQKKFKDRNLKNINLSLQEATNLSFEDGFFDAAVCINVFLSMDSIDSIINALYEMKRVCKKSGRIIFDFRNRLNPLLVAKYKLARYYDDTIRNLPFNTYSPKQIKRILKDLNLTIVNQRFIGFPLKRFAPIIIIEAEKNDI